MLKLPKKITHAIAREFDTTDFTIIKRVYIHSMYKELCVNLIMFRLGQSKSTLMMRYFGDNSYSICGSYINQNEIVEELQYQIKKFY